MQGELTRLSHIGVSIYYILAVDRLTDPSAFKLYKHTWLSKVEFELVSIQKSDNWTRAVEWRADLHASLDRLVWGDHLDVKEGVQIRSNIVSSTSVTSTWINRRVKGTPLPFHGLS